MSTRDAKEPIDPDDLGDLLATPDFAPPAGLAATILGTALTRRQPGSPSGEWASTPITPQEGYLRAVAGFGSLLASLTDKDWQQPAPTAHASWTVPDVVSHVIAIERYQAALLSGHQSQFVEQEGDHHAFTLPSVAELRTLDRVSVLERWRSATAENMVSAGSADLDLGRRVSFHGVPMRTHSLLVVRTFEIDSFKQEYDF